MKEKKIQQLGTVMLIVICCLFLSIGCTQKKQDLQNEQLIKELKLLNNSVEDYLAVNKNFVWKVEEADYIDSIYNLGNILIEQIDRQQVDTSILNALIEWSINHKKHTRAFFTIEPSSLNNEVYREVSKQKIRFLQSTFLIERLELILLSHYQSEGIGLYPINRKQWPDFKAGETYNLDFFIQYTTPLGLPKPIVTINGDTLIHQKDSPIYTYTFRPTKKGKIDFNRAISLYRWTGMYDVDFSYSPIEVEVK